MEKYNSDWALYKVISCIEQFYKINLYGHIPLNGEMLRTGISIASNQAIREGNIQKYQAINLIGHSEQKAK